MFNDERQDPRTTWKERSNPFSISAKSSLSGILTKGTRHVNEPF